LFITGEEFELRSECNDDYSSRPISEQAVTERIETAVNPTGSIEGILK
jgi:hypothetical protein